MVCLVLTNLFTRISKAMKKFLIKVVLFIAFLAVIDRLAGFAFSYFSENAKGGYTEHYHYLVDKTKEDVLVFGSSRAIHHYNPRIISDSLGMTCYNCGQDGNGIVLFYGWWKMITERYHPQYLIYDITTSYDILIGEDNHKYLGWLKEGYDRNGIKDIFRSVDKTEPYKMVSQMYRYNSKWHQIVADYIHPIYHFENQGFLPLDGTMDKMRLDEKKMSRVNAFEYDTLKITYLKELIKEHGNTKLVFVMSPSWYGINDDELRPLYELCKSYNIPFINFGNDVKYIQNEKYFIDGLHLNAIGADEYTKDLVESIRELGII